MFSNTAHLCHFGSIALDHPLVLVYTYQGETLIGGIMNTPNNPTELAIHHLISVELALDSLSSAYLDRATEFPERASYFMTRAIAYQESARVVRDEIDSIRQNFAAAYCMAEMIQDAY